MEERILKIWDRVCDEYRGVCKLALFFVAGSVAWMELVSLIGSIGSWLLA